jgi:hypothetical protein
MSPDDIDDIMLSQGVAQIACTLMPGRCGSTFLAGLAESYGFGTGAEVFNEMPLSTYEAISATRDFSDLLLHVLNMHVKNGIFYFQSTPARMANLLSICPMHKSKIGITYTVLLRRNFLAQAISYLNALESGRWHSFTSQKSADEPQSPTVSPIYGGVHPIDWWMRSILRTEIDVLKLVKPTGTDMLPILYYEELAATGIETFIHFLRMNKQKVNFARLAGIIDDSSLPQRLPRPNYISNYVDAIQHRDELLDLLEQRAASGFDLEKNMRFLSKFEVRDSKDI